MVGWGGSDGWGGGVVGGEGWWSREGKPPVGGVEGGGRGEEGSVGSPLELY